MPNTLKNKVIIITGASRGIGREMALKFAKDGAIIVIAAKSSDPHPVLPGTIHSVAKEVEEAGGTAIPIQIDVRDADNIKKLCDGIGEKFGRIDAVINNAGVIHVQGVEPTPPKKFDLMYQVNQRAVFCFGHFALPWLEKSDDPYILNLSPPISMNNTWFKDYSPYTTTKYSMSMLTKGMALEFKDKCDGKGIRVNSLWPQTYIATAAIGFAAGTDEVYKVARKPAIMADAAYEVLTSGKYNGEWLIDEKVLRAAGVEDFLPYANEPSFAAHIKRDLFVDEDIS